jgi:tRNA dimethylallyltransferase
MGPPASPEAIVVTGPTGTGKSALAVEVAVRLNGAVVSADSRQIYRHMDIGTAKPPAALRERVPHYGLDLLEPDESYSAGRFARDAWRWIEEIGGSGKVPVVVGGTGFFIRALLEPLGQEPELPPERRTRLRRYLACLPVGELHRWLKRLDPQRAEQLVGEGGSQRLGRSLEVVLLSGRPHSWWLGRPGGTAPLVACVCCLALPREELNRRIDQRFDRMIEAGLLDEVRELFERFAADAPGLNSVGYMELIGHLRGATSLEVAVAAAKRSTRRYARRQVTWFRHQLPEDTVWLAADRSLAELADEVVRAWDDRPVSLAGSEVPD